MFRETILNILDNVWPMLVIICTIIISLRVLDIIQNKRKFVFYKEVFYLGFIVYVICLFHTVTFQDVAWGTSNFIPFKEMLRYSLGSPLFIRNVLGNVLMFIPYGFFITYLFRFQKVTLPFILTLILSVVIETTQLLIGRVFDIDDITLNVIGGILGYTLFSLLNDIKKHFPPILSKAWFYNVITILIIAFVILYLLEMIKIGGTL